MLQSHVGESKLQAQAGESSGAESVIFKEHFGGQEAREEQQGREQPPKHSISTISFLLIFQPESFSKFPLTVSRVCVRGHRWPELLPIRCSHHFPVPPSPPPSSTLSSPHPLPLLVTGSGVTVECRHWPCLLVRSSVSALSWEHPEPAFPLLLLGPVHIPAFQPHWYTAGRGEEGKRRGSTGLGAAEVEKLVWKSSRTLFISRMLSSPSVTPGIYSGCRS